jgi:glutaredoxin
MFLSWLRFWRWGRKPVSLRHWRIVLFTRQGCHLCDTAWEQLAKAKQKHGFALTAMDVDTEAELAARHGMHVPVVEINGVVRFRGRINEVMFRRLIDAEK